MVRPTARPFVDPKGTRRSPETLRWNEHRRPYPKQGRVVVERRWCVESGLKARARERRPVEEKRTSKVTV